MSSNESGTENNEEQRSQGIEAPKVEVSATTVARMMGIPTVTDLKLIEGKVELLSSKINNVTVKVEKIMSVLNTVPTSTDFDRLDIQVGSVKTIAREILETIVDLTKATNVEDPKERAEAIQQGEKLRSGIKTND